MMLSLRLTFLGAVLALAGGCTRQADMARPRTFRDAGIVFDYPGNWKITKNETNPYGRLIFVEEPGSALAILTVYGAAFDVSLEGYAEEFRKNIGTQVPFNMLRHSSVAAREGAIDCKYSLQFAGINVPHTANLTKHVFGDIKVICLTQVADEDRRLVDAGFGLVRKTLGVVDSKKPDKATEPAPAK
jgi:hypothetical protein